MEMNQIHQYALEDQSRYPSMKLFCVHKGKGEIFDFDFEMENRDHKLLRTRFSFGGETHNEPGAIITDVCTLAANVMKPAHSRQLSRENLIVS